MIFPVKNMRITCCLLASLLMIPLRMGLAEEHWGNRISPGDVLCFGEPDTASGFDGKWLVLDNEQTNTGGPGIFLVSLNLIGGADGEPLLFRDIGDVSVSFSDRGEEYAAAHPGGTDYQGSDIQNWCVRFMEEHITAAEQKALRPTFKSDEAIVIPSLRIPLPGAEAGTVDFDPAPDVLTGYRMFMLSVTEVTEEKYGFAENRS